MSKFLHHDLRLLNPSFDTPLLDVITELEYLRRLEIKATTPSSVFFQLKHVFHLLESFASARIEGNHTTLADYIDSKVIPASPTDQLNEIQNIEQAMSAVEDIVVTGEPITEHMLRGLHSTAVEGLQREGDRTPGAYRTGPISIAKADHQPPDAHDVPMYMAELMTFINAGDPPKYDLMKVALAHHRFAWIHPFGNGNGRVVRLLTYALLIKYGFRVSDMGRLLNPAAVFCADREKYYLMLSQADKGTSEGLEDWCTYVLTGVSGELRKVHQLADYTYLTSKILRPAIAYARSRQHITPQEEAILNATVKQGVVKSGDLESAMQNLKPSQRTYQIKKLVESGMLQPTHEGARQYALGFTHNLLLRSVIGALLTEGFIPAAMVTDRSGAGGPA